MDELEGFAARVGTDGPVTCVGGRSQWAVGGAPSGEVREVSAPVGIVEVQPAEMTVRVRAGTTVAELAAALASVNQRALLPEPAPLATVGGVLAVGHSRLDRLGYGPVRDVLLEARYVSDRGELVKAGGPTVKNVSGFDLCRVLVGSLGTLGLLGEVVLRTRPIPAASRWWSGPADLAGVQGLRGRLHRPAAVLWDGGRAWVLLEGHPADVESEGALLAVEGLGPAAGPPPLPPHRSSVAPGDLARQTAARAPGSFVAEVGVGTLHQGDPPYRRPVPEPVAALHRRLKAEFDPAGRLNPGRDPLRPG